LVDDVDDGLLGVRHNFNVTSRHSPSFWKRMQPGFAYLVRSKAFLLPAKRGFAVEGLINNPPPAIFGDGCYVFDF
jgi:hypothetical protein